jgi:TRAP-type C4-dicarboxylate transport system permease small subunit
MQGLKILAIVLIAAGVLALVYGGFTYTQATHQANIGPVNISVQDNRTVDVPIWAGVGAIVLGGALLLAGSRKSQ